MASMFIRHQVNDLEAWRPVFDEHEAERKKYGITGHSLHRDADDPHVVIIALRADDLRKAKEFANSETLRSAMQRAGVQGTPEIWFATDLEDKRYH